MEFQSILFKRKVDIKSEAPYFFKDLNLDKIVANITLGKSQYRLQPFFYTPLSEKDEILYRQDIMKELMENKDLVKKVEEFAQNMRTMRKYFDQEKRLTHPLQKQRWFIDGVNLYCDAIVSFEEELSDISLKSAGFSSFYTYLNEYVNSPSFSRLKSDTKELEKELSEVRYTLLIKGNRVRVKRYEGEEDYTKKIEETFDRFRRGKVKDYTLSFYDMAQMNHVEEKVLELVAKLYRDTFIKLEAYSNRYREFLDPKIARFDREVQFYLSYLTYMGFLAHEGLSFALPEIASSKEGVYVYNGFDMGLAYKLKTEKKKPPVCNDFYLEKGERVLIITGPNQGGKTTFARMFGQIHYFSLLGLPVPSKKAKIFLVDKIFTHFEREENIKDLRGKLEDDLLRIRDILKVITPKSLVIMNEIFSSTTLEDAVSLSKIILEKILKTDAFGVMVTFLDELSTMDKRIVSMVAEVKPEDPTIRTYKITRREADGLSYAMTLAVKYRLTYKDIKKRITR